MSFMWSVTLSNNGATILFVHRIFRLSPFLIVLTAQVSITALSACPKVPAHSDFPFTMRYKGRTIPETIDHLSAISPERVWARYATSSESFERGELCAVTFSALARAVDTLARHLHDQIDLGPRSNVALYIGPSDIRYFVLACAACKYSLKVSTTNPGLLSRTTKANKDH